LSGTGLAISGAPESEAQASPEINAKTPIRHLIFSSFSDNPEPQTACLFQALKPQALLLGILFLAQIHVNLFSRALALLHLEGDNPCQARPTAPRFFLDRVWIFFYNAPELTGQF